MNQEFESIVSHLNEEYSKLQVGRASAGLVEGINVDAYGMMQPLKTVASISIPDAKTVQIQPWDRGMLAAIEKAIQVSDLNINPVNNGLAILLNIPPLTEERRKDLVKVVHRLAEEAKIAIRNIRHDAMTRFKKQEHENEISEDDRIRSEKNLQEEVDLYNKKVDDLSRAKEEAVMTV